MKKIVSLIMAVVMCLSVVVVGSTVSVGAKTKTTVKLKIVDMNYKSNNGYVKFKVLSNIRKNTYYVQTKKGKTNINKNKCFILPCKPNGKVTINLINKYNKKYNKKKSYTTKNLFYRYYAPDNGETPICF